MRVESSVTSVTWIPSEAISGMPKIPFELGVSHYDDPPPDRLVDLEAMHENDMFREANELRAWIEVDDDGKIVDQGYEGGGRVGVTRLKLAGKEVSFAAVQYPLLRSEPEVRDGEVRFQQSAGGHMGLPAPRRVRSKPFFKVSSASAWTTLGLTIRADGSSSHEVVGASPFPRHWIYDKDGVLVEKSASIDFDTWYRESHGKKTPWGEEDSPAMVSAVESELERELSESIMRSGAKLERRELDAGEALVEEGEAGRDLFLILDGSLDVEVNGDVVAQVGPGAVLGEGAHVLGEGKRMASLWASTPVRVVVIPPESIDPAKLPELAAGRKQND
jgi:hypothetical protein